MIDSTSIAYHLSKIADEHPGHLAIVIANSNGNAEQYTYRQLDEVSDNVAKGLRKVGIKKGTRTVLMVLPGLDFFALVFALFKVGAVLVGIDPGMGIKNLGKCLQESEPEAFIGNRKAHIARHLLRWAKETLNIKITTESLPLPGSSTINLSHVKKLGETDEEEFIIGSEAGGMAAILFTSGSTGVPKGVIYTHANFVAQVKALVNTFDIKPGEIDLATFPLFAIFAPAMGMTSIIPEMDFTKPGNVDPTKIFYAIDKYDTTTMFGSPALLNRVGRWGKENNIKLPSLKRMLSAGAPVAPPIMERFLTMLEPDVEIYTPYGATESLPVSSIGSKEILAETRALTDRGKGTCVGPAVEGMNINIIEISDDPIEEWNEDLVLEANKIGEIVVQGAQVTKAYYNREHSNKLAKIIGPDGSVFYRMGDVGYLDDQNRLWFCGRKNHRIVTETKTYFSIPCEGIFSTHPKVFRTALVGIIRNGATMPALCVELEAEYKKDNRKEITAELLAIGSRYIRTSVIKDFLYHPGFPVDIRHNAKIGREKLAIWAMKQLQ